MMLPIEVKKFFKNAVIDFYLDTDNKTECTGTIIALPQSSVNI